MSLNIKMNNFEGPFDLLLHLIKKNKMDIYDIKIHYITNQYLDYIHTMNEMDLEVTSEFIVIAATLIEIKSKTLLPKTNNDEVAADLEEKDVEKELVNKLVQYKKFKSAATFLGQRQVQTGHMYGKKPEIIREEKKDIDPLSFLKNITIVELFEIYNKLLSDYREKMNTNGIIDKEIPIDKFKIEDKILYIIKNLKANRRTSFSHIIKGYSSKLETIVTFLALLELIKLKYIFVTQENNFKEIYLERVGNGEKLEYQSIGNRGSII
ncbi:segregation/condensation protein A [Clostridium fermenticellae]|uniref:Segregation and condensation protein A n=1 Tax=Clostridium fermenticellae TaxID=2068654 RepID=A0A386H781_9CLOT|nr:segregation/condensation protein A [Clostridium fermenticellae]AYD41448.1 segregation/condensation protein A [Clostridium fermenticellae]